MGARRLGLSALAQDDFNAISTPILRLTYGVSHGKLSYVLRNTQWKNALHSSIAGEKDYR